MRIYNRIIIFGEASTTSQTMPVRHYGVLDVQCSTHRTQHQAATEHSSTSCTCSSRQVVLASRRASRPPPPPPNHRLQEINAMVCMMTTKDEDSCQYGWLSLRSVPVAGCSLFVGPGNFLLRKFLRDLLAEEAGPHARADLQQRDDQQGRGPALRLRLPAVPLP